MVYYEMTMLRHQTDCLLRVCGACIRRIFRKSALYCPAEDDLSSALNLEGNSGRVATDQLVAAPTGAKAKRQGSRGSHL